MNTQVLSQCYSIITAKINKYKYALNLENKNLRKNKNDNILIILLNEVLADYSCLLFLETSSNHVVQVGFKLQVHLTQFPKC